jgi:hypothetical protein
MFVFFLKKKRDYVQKESTSLGSKQHDFKK